MMATSENESEWLQSAFIDDSRVGKMEKIQDRQFLRTGLRPTLGQRIELELNLRPEFAPGKTGKTWCNFSGQVTRVKPVPAEAFPEELQEMLNLKLSLGGVKHGQEVVCEGRLNFDYDSTYM
jgi:hypothetical protein